MNNNINVIREGFFLKHKTIEYGVNERLQLDI